MKLQFPTPIWEKPTERNGPLYWNIGGIRQWVDGYPVAFSISRYGQPLSFAMFEAMQ